MNGEIFDIQRFSVNDGPGIRTTVFFKGCNLKCRWCHNPESQSAQPQILFYADKCTGCGRCKSVTPNDTDFICFHDAKEICGRTYSVEEVLNEVLKDKMFYDNSGGGVTFSGGECMLQVGFLQEVLKACRANGIHTAVDTAGNVPWESFERILNDTDLFLYDVKLFDGEKHKRYTGVDNRRILENLTRLLDAKANVYIRIPIIGGVNDSTEEMEKIRDFLRPHRPQRTELLPYHALGLHKYEALGMEKQEFSVPDEALMRRLRAVFA